MELFDVYFHGRIAIHALSKWDATKKLQGLTFVGSVNNELVDLGNSRPIVDRIEHIRTRNSAESCDDGKCWCNTTPTETLLTTDAYRSATTGSGE